MDDPLEKDLEKHINHKNWENTRTENMWNQDGALLQDNYIKQHFWKKTAAVLLKNLR